MTAMMDGRCTKCGRRIGWCGTMSNMPACPKCGHRPPQADLDADEAEMEAFREQLRTHPKNADADMRRKQRVAAGLTLRQAAKLLGMGPNQLADLEHGREELTPEMAELMAQVYGVGP